MKESVDQLVSMWAPRWPLHNGAIYEVQSQDRPNWFSRPRGRSQSTRKRQLGCHAQPPFPANSWTHDYGVQIWWEARMATHPKNVPGSGLMVGHIRAWGRRVQRMGHEHSATECLRKWSWSNIFWGAGALYVRKLWKMRRSSCQVERLRPFAYLWENTSLDRRYLHWPGISWHSCSGDKCFYSQAASPSQTSHATITLDSAAWSIFTDPFL